MPAFGEVLVPIDFSSGCRAALEVARTIARAAKARLTLLHVYPNVEPQALGESLSAPEYHPLDDAERARIIRQLATLARPLRSDVARLELVVRDGDPRTEILAYAEGHATDLIVLGTHGRRGLDRLVLGSVAKGVSRKATCSVLTVREPAAPYALAARPRILCALDLSASSGATLDAAVDLARTLAARLTVAHVIEGRHGDDPWPIARREEGEVCRFLAEAAHERMSRLLARGDDLARSADVQVLFGDASAEILRLAREQAADLVVVGTHAGPVSRLLFGSTADRLLHKAACPVLIARPDRAEGSREANEVDAVMRA